MGSLDRRRLFFENDSEYNPSLTFDVNEYLIEEWPMLSAKARKAVWITCQNDDQFDYSHIEEQVDEHVYAYAETDPSVELPTIDPDDDEEEDVPPLFTFNLQDYFDEYWPTLTEEQSTYFAFQIINEDVLDLSDFTQSIDNVIFAAAEEDESIVLPELDEDNDDE